MGCGRPGCDGHESSGTQGGTAASGHPLTSGDADPLVDSNMGWDGVLTTGHRPVQGIYLLRLEVASDRGDEALQRVISLAY